MRASPTRCATDIRSRLVNALARRLDCRRSHDPGAPAPRGVKEHMLRSPYRAIRRPHPGRRQPCRAACGSDDDRFGLQRRRQPPPPSSPQPRRSRSVSSPTSAASTTARSTRLPTRASSRPRPSSASRAACSPRSPNADYVPNLSTLAQQKYDLDHRRRLPDGRRDRARSPRSFPDAKFAIIDYSAGRAEEQAQERPRACCSRSRRPATSPATSPASTPRTHKRRPRSSQRRRPEDPAGRPLHRRLPGRRQEGEPRRSRRSTATPRTSSTRRSARRSRSTRSREGSERRLPGRRPVRPRRARRRQGEGRAGHRRRRRPGLPRRAHPHERPEEGRRRPCSPRSSASRRARSRAAPTTSSTSKNDGVGLGKLSAAASRTPARSRRSRRSIEAGEIADVPDTVK